MEWFIQKKKSMAGIELSAAWEGIWISSVNWLGGETDVLETFGQTEETYAVLTYDFPGGDYASCLYLHARENSTLNVTMVLTGGKDQKGSSSVQVKAYAEKNAHIKIFAVQLLGQEFTCFHDFGGVCEEKPELNWFGWNWVQGSCMQAVRRI